MADLLCLSKSATRAHAFRNQFIKERVTNLLRLLLTVLFVSTCVTAHARTETQKVFASDGWLGNDFGQSLSISGDRAIVGAAGDEDNGINSGAAYIFEVRASGEWVEKQKLTLSDGDVDDVFGGSVSLSGDRAIVGAPGYDNGDSTGSVYIYEVNASGDWVETQKIIASDGVVDGFFGGSVSLSGDRAIVSEKRRDDNGDISGSAYIFELNGSGDWVETQKLTASDGATNDLFGTVSLSGDRAIIGAQGDDDNGNGSGSAYIFELNSSGVWVETQKLVASDGAPFDRFGESVSLSGGRAIVGAYGNEDRGEGTGSAYIFEVNASGDWVETQKLVASDGAKGDYFGDSVSVSVDRAIVGAFGDDDNNVVLSGSAYIYELNASGYWVETQKLTASDGEEVDYFGLNVSISGDRAIVGSGGAEPGSAYIFESLGTLASSQFEVNGNTITFNTYDWYQVQDDTNYVTFCEGFQPCHVPDGDYIIINHAYNDRYNVSIGGGASDGGGTGSGATETLTWPNDGWYQIQDAVTLASICEGGTSCDVHPGTYYVINLTTGHRSTVVVKPSNPTYSDFIIDGNVVTFTAHAWFQIQDQYTYHSVCEGFDSCHVPDGNYQIINFGTGEIWMNVQISSH